MASSSSEQQLRFRWNDHMQHISKVLTLQRFEEQFCDVTLVSEDGFVMKAHQAILASTSAYFQRVFSDITADQHPMVVLRGANFREMSCLLDYMYQGSTQVHQSLMESVLEVADMLEVKGLSQIRSNNSIKKYMVPPSSSTTTSTTTTHGLSGDNNIGRPRSPEEQSGTHIQDEQMYHDSQPRTSELESTTWMRFSGNNLSETRSKEPVRTHVEGPVTPTEDPPPSTHARILPCQDSSNQENQEESQMSGMDLSMAKNEPWSPKEAIPNDDKNSSARKRRKLLEGICSEESVEPVSDPDWGRIGTKVDDRPLCQPRTISFTSITSETESHPEDKSYGELAENSRGPFSYQPKSPVDQVSFTELPTSTTSYLQHPLQVSKEEYYRGIAFQSGHTSSSSSKGSATCPCKGPCKSSEFKASTGTQDGAFRNKRKFSMEGKQSDLAMDGQSIDKNYHSNRVILGYYGTSQATNVLMQSSDGVADQSILRPSLMNDPRGSPVLLSVPLTSGCGPVLSQSPVDGDTDDIKKMEMHGKDLKRSEVAPERRECIARKSFADSLGHPLPHHEKASETATLFVDKAINNAGAEESLNYETNCSQEGVDGSHSYVIGQRQPPNATLGSSIEMSAAGFAVSSPVQLIYCSSLSSTSKAAHKTEDYLYVEPVNSNLEDAGEDPLEIVPMREEVNVAAQAPEEETPVTSFVSLNHREHLLVKDAEPTRKSQCLLEERLLKPKNDVKRPMNPYMLFQNEMKKKVIADNPGEPYQVTLKRLGYLWKHLSPSERGKWQARADDLKREHKRLNPDYQYNPYEAYKKRQQYLQARVERSLLYRVPSENGVGGDTDTVMVSPNLYKPLQKD